ncbi:uncharacterized protein LOC127527557 [Erpetoichthys calabaricus]|uniref:uncharacterized protein LOC127527557 n=1 Tax=Erpetoichthys calabaricus TaxID=27687 RepID=UPI002234B1BE|nr:uncharacterized protein LOC127527557 [Erpetoichthys calabaricus]
MYFDLGLEQKDILLCLAHNHGIIVSLRTLQRNLQCLNLYRRKHKTDSLDLALFLQQEINKSGRLHGYKWMHAKCLAKGFVTDSESIRFLLKTLDPEGVEQRKRRCLRRRQFSSKGPNNTWHIDSNDKLKPYGIFINGCIDGFSRFIIWLEASNSGKAGITANYFAQAVKKRNGCPCLVRADLGVENVYVEKMQKFLRRNNTDFYAAENSFIYGQSRTNQRIEFWWGILRKQNLQFWMDLFRQIQVDGYFSGDFLDKELIRFCFMKLIQAELDDVVAIWNRHRMRANPSAILPSGKPFLLYTLPELFGYQDELVFVDHLETEVCEEESIPKNEYPCDPDIHELCCILMEENGFSMPSDPFDAVTLYQALKTIIHNLLEKYRYI